MAGVLTFFHRHLSQYSTAITLGLFICEDTQMVSLTSERDGPSWREYSSTLGWVSPQPRRCLNDALVYTCVPGSGPLCLRLVSNGYCQVPSVILVLDIGSDFGLTSSRRREARCHCQCGLWWVISVSACVSLLAAGHKNDPSICVGGIAEVSHP